MGKDRRKPENGLEMSLKTNSTYQCECETRQSKVKTVRYQMSGIWKVQGCTKNWGFQTWPPRLLGNRGSVGPWVPWVWQAWM